MTMLKLHLEGAIADVTALRQSISKAKADIGYIGSYGKTRELITAFLNIETDVSELTVRIQDVLENLPRE